MIRIIGNHVSPYAKKVFLTLDHKAIEYEVDVIVPYYGDDSFTGLNPLRRIPILIDGDFVLPDSTAICEYLEDRYPERSLRPADVKERAKARWVEEMADSWLSDALLWKLFYHRVIRPRLWKVPMDEAAIAQATDHDIPEMVDWLEGVAPTDGFLFGELSLADLSCAAFFRSAALSSWEPDPARWPHTAGWVARVQALPLFQRSVTFEQIMLTTKLVDQRAALEAAGLKVTTDSVRSATPRRSPLLI
jgi:glutathione S-transferase